MKTFLTLISPTLSLLMLASGGCAGDAACKSLNSAAVTLCEQGQWRDAANVAKEALKQAEEAGEPYRLEALKSLQLLVKLNEARGNLAEAQRFCSKAYTTSVAVYGPGHPNNHAWTPTGFR